MTLLEYAEIEINALNEQSVPYIQEFLNYAVEIDEYEIVLALMETDALFNALNHFAHELGIEKHETLDYIVNMVTETSVEKDAVKTFSKVIKFDQEHTHFFANPSNLSILLQSIAQKDADKISALILEDDALLLKPQSCNIEFNLCVAIKEDNLNGAKKLLEDLEFSDIEGIVDIIIAHDAEEIIHHIIHKIGFNRESRKFLAECINTAIINNSTSVLEVLLTSTLMTEIFSNEAQKNWMANYLLNVINKNSSEAGLASLILVVGDVEESDIDILMGLAIKNNLTWVMDWMFKNDYEIDRAKDPSFIFALLNDALNEDNGEMIAYLVSKIKIDHRDLDEVARYEEILNSLMEQSIRYESIDTLHKLISLRGNFDINSPLNKMKQSGLQIALTDFEPIMFWFLVEEYLKTEISVAEAMSHLDDMKMNLWHYAANSYDKSKIQALLNSMFEFFGEDGINQQNSAGNTPIMISAANRN